MTTPSSTECWKSVVHRMLDFWREGAALRAMINETSEHAIPSYGANPTTTSEAIRQAETVAGEERRRLGLGNAPIGNLAALISAQGIWAAATRLPDSQFFLRTLLGQE